MMAEEFRYALMILGVLSLVALVVHGLWSNRKNAQETQSRFYNEEKEKPAEGFDEFGVGKKRVLTPGEKPTPKPTVTLPPRGARVREPVKVMRKEPPEFSQQYPDVRAEPSVSFSAYDEIDGDTSTENEAQAQQSAVDEVLILYVLLPEGHEIEGGLLLPSLLTLGFKYGEMNIFHRHQDNAGSGEVLFSLANMFNPGTFDLEDIDKLQTRGLSLFLRLPGPGDALQNFNLMHNAAKKLADEFGGQVLDGQRSMLTVQTVRHYVERIREFQRQQLLRS